MATNAKAQLAGTQWQAVINIPMPVKAMFDFKQDTLFLIDNTTMDSGFVHEIMKYKFENNILTLQKISGDSPCEDSTIGKYKSGIQRRKNVSYKDRRWLRCKAAGMAG